MEKYIIKIIKEGENNFMVGKSKTTTSKKKKKDEEDKIPQPKINCTRCGKEKKIIDDFYKSNSEMFKANNDGRLCICKECVGELFDKFKNRYITDILAIYEMCKTLDAYFNKSAFNTALNQAEKKNSNIASIYFQKINSLPQWSGKTFDQSDALDEEDKKIKNDEGEELIPFEVDNEMIVRWGRLSKDDIEFLENNYYQWTTRHKCETRAEEILFEEICQMQLEIKKTRETGGDTMKKVEALQKLMTSANIRPVEQNAINTVDSALMMGTMIATIEKYDPCEFFEEEKKKEYRDYKGYKRYFENWSLRPLKNLITGTKDFNIVEDIDDKVDE